MNDSDNPYAFGAGDGGYAQGAGSVNGTMDFGGAQTAAPAGVPADVIKDTTTAKFMADVVQESRKQPVLVDFWAPWCGPCKQLTPVLEKVVREAKGRVKLVKLNIDEYPQIPGQMGVQSIPAVIAFVNGQPADGFMGAVPESQVKAFIDKLAGAGGTDEAAEIESVLQQGRERLAEGDLQGAAQIFNAVMQHAPENVAAKAGMAECLITAGQTERASELLNGLSEKERAHPEIAKILTRIALQEEAARLGDPSALKARIEADPRDFQARVDLAKILNIQGEREAAAEQLFAIMKLDREWENDAGRRELLTFFDAWGPKDPVTLAMRRRLSSILFS
jgi:putative thioredoxin